MANIKMYEGSDANFLAACSAGDAKPTRRQFRKWKQGRGLAWTNRQPTDAEQIRESYVVAQPSPDFEVS